ncbi:MAG: hypothetical protein VB099_16425 [Candidatus Limiplasma sp.]|nr:hypothetical protein [Candidatus Limiplasma sp.]
MAKTKRRVLKKWARRWMDKFTRTKIPLAFSSETERKEYVKAWARARAGYPNKWDKEDAHV